MKHQPSFAIPREARAIRLGERAQHEPEPSYIYPVGDQPPVRGKKRGKKVEIKVGEDGRRAELKDD